MAEHDLVHKVSPFCDPHLLVQAEGPLDFLLGQAEYFPQDDILSAKVALLGLDSPATPAPAAAGRAAPVRRAPVKVAKATSPSSAKPRGDAKPPSVAEAAVREVVTCVDILAGASRRIECF